MNKILRWLGMATEARLDDQFDLMIDYVDVVEESLQEQITELDEVTAQFFEVATDVLKDIQARLPAAKVKVAKKVAKKSK